MLWFDGILRVDSDRPWTYKMEILTFGFWLGCYYGEDCTEKGGEQITDENMRTDYTQREKSYLQSSHTSHGVDCLDTILKCIGTMFSLLSWEVHIKSCISTILWQNEHPCGLIYNFS